MSARDSWDSVQNRWAAGEALSVEEERRRKQGSLEDPLAVRELALFAELSGRLEQKDDMASNVALTLAGARGVKLRVLGPDSVDVPPRAVLTKRRIALGASVGVVALAATVAVLVGRREAPASPPIAVVAKQAPAAAPATVSRSELVFASGDVRVRGASAVVGKQTLVAGTEVATARGRACLTIDPAVDVCLDAESSVMLEDLAETSVRVRITRGTAVAALAPRKPGHRFALVGGDVLATAHGTVFALELEPGGARVTVVEGSVAVGRASEKPRVVGAHSSLGVGSQLEDIAAVGRSDEARLHALLAPRELWQGGNLGVLEIAEARSGERAVIDEHGPFELPLRLFVATGRHRVGLRAEQRPEAAVDVDVDAGAARRVSAAEIDGAAASTVSSAPLPDAKTLLDRARQRLSAGDPRAARDLYREIRRAYPGSSEATTVLVTLGTLELELGGAVRALAAFDAYVEHGGALVPEALSGRIRALRSLGRRAEERRAIEQYLSRYPTGLEAPALKQRLATLTSG
jgi:hypothetical protein